MSTAQIDLVNWLREQPDDDLARLLVSRPDLLHPVPSDIEVLATRAAGRASVEIALDRLDVGALQVVEAMVLSPDPTDLDAVAKLLDVESTRLAPALDRLRQAVVVWGHDDQLRLLPVVRDLMPAPAALGPPARTLLEHVPRSQLAGLLADLGLTSVGDPTLGVAAGVAAVDALADLLEDPAQLSELLARAPEAAREVVELLAVGPPTGRIPAARRPVDAASAESPVRWLLAHALLIAVDDFTVVLPREVAMQVRGGHAFRAVELDPPAGQSTKHKQADVDASAAGQAFTVVRLVEALLERWGVEPPGVLRAGGLGVRDLRRTARELELDERAAALLIEVAHAAGLIAPDAEMADSWLPTTGYDLWLAKSVADRWVILISAWLTTTRVPGLVGRREPPFLSTAAEIMERPQPAANALGGDLDRALAPIVRREVLEILLRASPGEAPTAESVNESLRWSWPRRGGRLRDDLAGWTIEEAELLGLTGRGALSSFGRRLCVAVDPSPEADAEVVAAGADPAAMAAALLDELLPRPLDHVLLQADLTAVAPGPLESDLARELAMAADIESTGGATVFRFSDTSIRRALDSGRSAADLHALLAARSRTPVPQPLSYLIDDVARRHGRIRIGVAGSYIRCDDDGLLNEVLADRRVESLRLRRLAPSVLVSPLAPERVAERLREVGYAPAAESPDGALLLRRPDAGRAPARPRPLRRRPELAAPAASVVSVAVRAIRGGDRAVTSTRGMVVGGSASDVVPHSASSETLAVLQDAVRTGRAVWIGYLNAQGQASNNEQGFLSLQALTTAEEVAEIKAELEGMFAKRAGEKEGAFLDLVAGEDHKDEMSSPQIFNPANYSAKLHKTRAFQNAFSIAKQLLGEETRFFFDLSILKQPKVGAGTPWHQDEAFRDANFTYRELSIWMPLQDVTAESGCLRYIPGSNKGNLKQHKSVNDDPTSHAVTVSEAFAEETAVLCPMPAGGCVMHQPRTIHGSTSNGSETPRLAYIMAFGLPPEPLKEGRTFAWAAEKRTAASERNRQWMRRGGMFVMLWRKLRRGDLFSWKLAVYNSKRLMRSLGLLR